MANLAAESPQGGGSRTCMSPSSRGWTKRGCCIRSSVATRRRGHLQAEAGCRAGLNLARNRRRTACSCLCFAGRPRAMIRSTCSRPTRSSASPATAVVGHLIENPGAGPGKIDVREQHGARRARGISNLRCCAISASSIAPQPPAFQKRQSAGRSKRLGRLPQWPFSPSRTHQPRRHRPK